MATIPPSARERELMAAALERATVAAAEGEIPVGALLVDASGRVIACGRNSRVVDHDPTAHAEINAIREAAALRADRVLDDCTLVVTLEPCAMCAGAAYWAGIGRIVYGLSESTLGQITGNHPENPTLDLPCRVVLESGQRTVEVIGPMLEDEAAELHVSFWASR